MLGRFAWGNPLYTYERLFLRIEYYFDVIPARFSRARLDAAVQSSVALLGVIRCLTLGIFLWHILGMKILSLVAILVVLVNTLV